MIDTDAWRAAARKGTALHNQKHIAVDLDDVLLDFTGGVRRVVEQQFGVKVPEFTDWKIGNVLKPIIGRGWWRWMEDNVNEWAEFDGIEGGHLALVTLRNLGYRLEIVTSKPDWAEWVVWSWLGKRHLPVHGVTIVGKGDDKSDFSKAGILIDDRPENVEEWTSTGTRRGILFDRSHNRNYIPSNSRISRAVGWSGVLDELKEHP